MTLPASPARTASAYALPLLYLGVSCLIVRHLDFQNTWALVLPVLLPVGLLLAWKFPVVVFAALPFVGLFKSQAAVDFSATDPTVVMVALATAALAVEISLTFAGVREPALWRRVSNVRLPLAGYAALVGIMLISYLYTTAPHLAVTKVAKMAVISTMLFVGTLFVIRSPRELRVYIWTFVLLSTVVSIRTVIHVFHPLPGVDDITDIDSGQAGGAALLMLLFGTREAGTGNRWRWPLMGALAAGLVAAAARGPLLSTIFAASIPVLARRVSVSPRKLLYGAGALAVVLAAGVYWYDKLATLNPRFEDKRQEMVRLLSGDTSTGGSGRLQLYAEAINGFERRPILGWGAAGWVVSQTGYEHVGDTAAFQADYPHNIVLETAVEFGAIGLAVLMFLFASVASVISRVRKFASCAFVLPVIVHSFAVCMFSNDLNNRVLWACLGVTMAACQLAIAANKRDSGASPVA